MTAEDVDEYRNQGPDPDCQNKNLEDRPEKRSAADTAMMLQLGTFLPPCGRAVTSMRRWLRISGRVHVRKKLRTPLRGDYCGEII
jgi:hypothetical protein